ncbi:MAG: response regulator, partial [Verrucomicrobia bacterium]|nr:response regulator [Verrucomicrobiota bacterium]
HLLRMINDVLDLAKIEAGKIEVRPAPFALVELVNDVAAAHTPAAIATRLAVHRDLAPDLPAWVEGDAQKVRQILENLVGNAVKFTQRGGVTLRVSCRAGSPNPAVLNVPSTQTAGSGDPALQLDFAVIDTGPGIAPEDQAKLFQPFEQARSTRPAAPGTGLGLAISRALVERMGGALALASESGAGSTFSFSLPLPALSTPAPLATRPAVTGYDGPRRRVLIVDDHAINRSLLTDLLAPLGFDCAECASGEGALARLAAGQETWPDLAIVDLRMECMDGLELTRRLRALPRGRELKVLLTSASVISFNPAEAREAGCDDFLPKPFRTADLVEKIGALLALRWHSTTPVECNPIGYTAGGAAAGDVGLPEAARAALREVLAQGDLEAFRAALARVRVEHPAAAARWDALDEAAAGFQLSKLRSLLDQP